MKLNAKIAPVLLSASLLGSLAAYAAEGVHVEKSQAMMVKIGMTPSEVQQAIGRPARVSEFRNESGPTWTYQVAGQPSDRSVIDIDFDANGRVESVSERSLPTGGE